MERIACQNETVKVLSCRQPSSNKVRTKKGKVKTVLNVMVERTVTNCTQTLSRIQGFAAESARSDGESQCRVALGFSGL